MGCAGTLVRLEGVKAAKGLEAVLENKQACPAELDLEPDVRAHVFGFDLYDFNGPIDGTAWRDDYQGGGRVEKVPRLTPSDLLSGARSRVQRCRGQLFEAQALTEAALMRPRSREELP